MSDKSSSELGDLNIDTGNLYQEETFTDLRAASVRRQTPVKVDGTPDPERPTLYIGETTLMTQMGPFPVQFPIEADSLGDAFEKFPDGVKAAVERLNERAKELAREEASRIVVPSAMPQGVQPGNVPGAGAAGNKIFLKK
ncbi:MAG: hypothetical protein R3174_04570 [Gammaproteobacteria bacterium]|nr:hypothetical protein [Gammaproteobacteria bacterium]